MRFVSKPFIAVPCLMISLFLQGKPAVPVPDTGRGKLALMLLSPFERAVRCIKFYEGWHTVNDYPYIGYGHCLRPHEVLDSYLSVEQADSLVRSDLKEYCRLFRSYGKDSLLLATLSYNVGPYRILGNDKYPKSTLLSMIEQGNRNICREYVNFSFWRGKSVASIRRRRLTELRLLFEP